MWYTNIIILYIVLYNLTNVECYKKYKNYQNVRNYIVFHKYTIVWICDQIKYVIVYKKRHVCVFPPSSGSLEQFWVKGTGVCSCCVTHSFLLPFMPQAHLAWVCLLLWLKISRCQIPGGLEFSPSSVHLLPTLPLGERPQPGQAPAQPPPVVSVSLSPVWACWAPWRCRLALTELLGRAGGALLAGVLLWPLTCEPPATLGPPSPSVPAVLSASSSQWVWWLSPATSWRHNSLPLDLRIGSPTHLDFLGEPRGPSPVPFPRAQVLVQSCTPPDCPHSCLWTITYYIRSGKKNILDHKSGGRGEFIITWK